MTPKSLSCFAVYLCLAAAGYAESPNEAKLLFADNCLDCHDSSGKGTEYRLSDPIPDLTSKAWASSRTQTDLYDSILLGKGSDMPAFEDELNRSEIESLVTYIREISGTRAKTLGGKSSKKATGSSFASDVEALRQKWLVLARRYEQVASKQP